MPAMGIVRMNAFPVAERANFKIFQTMALGAAARVGGRFAAGTPQGAGEPFCLTTSDGGTLHVLAEPGEKTAALALGGFVEVCGHKENETDLRLAGVLCLGEGLDTELWNETVEMLRLPELRTLFEPSVGAGWCPCPKQD